jgi:hypothetical protein
MKLPSRLAINLGALYAAAVAISLELQAPHWVQVVIGATGTLLAALTIHPQQGTHEEHQLTAPPETAVKPDGAAPAAPPGI